MYNAHINVNARQGMRGIRKINAHRLIQLNAEDFSSIYGDDFEWICFSVLLKIISKNKFYLRLLITMMLHDLFIFNFKTVYV